MSVLLQVLHNVPQSFSGKCVMSCLHWTSKFSEFNIWYTFRLNDTQKQNRLLQVIMEIQLFQIHSRRVLERAVREMWWATSALKQEVLSLCFSDITSLCSQWKITQQKDRKLLRLQCYSRDLFIVQKPYLNYQCIRCMRIYWKNILLLDAKSLKEMQSLFDFAIYCFYQHCYAYWFTELKPKEIHLLIKWNGLTENIFIVTFYFVSRIVCFLCCPVFMDFPQKMFVDFVYDYKKPVNQATFTLFF